MGTERGIAMEQGEVIMKRGEPREPAGAPLLGPLGDHIGFQIHIARRALRQRMRRLETRRPAPAPGTISILTLIDLNPRISQQAIAEALFLDASKVALLVHQLEKSGMVERARSTEDRRRVELLLTRAGTDRLQEAMQTSALLEDQIVAGLSGSEQAELLRLLAKVQQALR